MAVNKVVEYLKKLQSDKRAPEAFFNEYGLVDRPSSNIGTGIEALESIFGKKTTFADDLQSVSQFDAISGRIMESNLFDKEGRFVANNIPMVQGKIQAYYDNIISENPGSVDILNDSMLAIRKSMEGLEFKHQEFSDAQAWVNSYIEEWRENPNFVSDKASTEYRGIDRETGMAKGNPEEVPGGIDQLEYDFMRLQDSDVMDWVDKKPHLENIAKVMGQMDRYLSKGVNNKWKENYVGGGDLVKDIGVMDHILSTYVTRLLMADDQSGGTILTEFEQTAFDQYQKSGSTKGILSLYETSKKQFESVSEDTSQSLRDDIANMKHEMVILNNPILPDDVAAVERYKALKIEEAEGRSLDSGFKLNKDKQSELRSLNIQVENPLYDEESPSSVLPTIDKSIDEHVTDILLLNKKLQSNEQFFTNINEGQRYFHMNIRGDDSKTGVGIIEANWSDYDKDNSFSRMFGTDGEGNPMFLTFKEIFVDDRKPKYKSKQEEEFKEKIEKPVKEKPVKEKPEEKEGYTPPEGVSEEGSKTLQNYDEQGVDKYVELQALRDEVYEQDSDATEQDLIDYYVPKAGDPEGAVNAYEAKVNEIVELENNKKEAYLKDTKAEGHATKSDLSKTKSLWEAEHRKILDKGAFPGFDIPKTAEEYWELADGTNPYKDVVDRLENYEKYIPGEAVQGFSMQDNAGDIIDSYLSEVGEGGPGYEGRPDYPASNKFFEKNPNLNDKDKKIKKELEALWFTNDKIKRKIDQTTAKMNEEGASEEDKKKYQEKIDGFNKELSDSKDNLQTIMDNFEVEDLEDISFQRTYGQPYQKNKWSSYNLKGTDADAQKRKDVSVPQDIVEDFINSTPVKIAMKETNIGHKPDIIEHSKKFFEANNSLNKQVLKDPLEEVWSAKMELVHDPDNKEKQDKYNESYSSFVTHFNYAKKPFSEGGPPATNAPWSGHRGWYSNIDWKDRDESIIQKLYTIPYDTKAYASNPSSGYKINTLQRDMFLWDLGIAGIGHEWGDGEWIGYIVDEIWEENMKGNSKKNLEYYTKLTSDGQQKQKIHKDGLDHHTKRNQAITKFFGHNEDDLTTEQALTNLYDKSHQEGDYAYWNNKVNDMTTEYNESKELGESSSDYFKRQGELEDWKMANNKKEELKKRLNK